MSGRVRGWTFYISFYWQCYSWHVWSRLHRTSTFFLGLHPKVVMYNQWWTIKARKNEIYLKWKRGWKKNYDKSLLLLDESYKWQRLENHLGRLWSLLGLTSDWKLHTDYPLRLLAALISQQMTVTDHLGAGGDSISIKFRPYLLEFEFHASASECFYGPGQLLSTCWPQDPYQAKAKLLG